jgi:hypothetical protein
MLLFFRVEKIVYTDGTISELEISKVHPKESSMCGSVLANNDAAQHVR